MKIEFIETHTVKLDGKVIGTIRTVERLHHPDGYQYFPKGQKTGGELFNTLGACKLSLKQ